MTKKSFLILFVLAALLVGCNNDEKSSMYTQSELEVYLIKDCKDVEYVFEDKNLIYTFDFEKTSKGNVGEYHRSQLRGYGYKDCNFIWDVEPSGDGGIVTMVFEGGVERTKVRMKLTEETYTHIVITQDGQQMTYNETKNVWKLDFEIKDDPFKGDL